LFAGVQEGFSLAQVLHNLILQAVKINLKIKMVFIFAYILPKFLFYLNFCIFL